MLYIHPDNIVFRSIEFIFICHIIKEASAQQNFELLEIQIMILEGFKRLEE
jgi:hypothetical protein